MRFTEAIHPNTTQLDQMSAKQLVTALQAAELEVFRNGWGGGLWDPNFLKQLKRLQAQIKTTLSHPRGKVVISGAGTSGRLALHAALTCEYNRHSPRVFGLLAGGPSAFFRAAEGVEDSPQAGIQDLSALPWPDGPSVLIGITCGLSAAYVAGTVHGALAAQFDAVAVLGFNPIEEANRRPLPGLGSTFHDLLTKLDDRTNGYLLLPAVGPEPLTGSTRMKGGTATKIVLDLCLNPDPIETGLAHCQKVLEATSGDAVNLDQLITRASRSFLDGGSLTYFTAGRSGLMTLLDASECPPTFGAGPDQVTALIDHGLARAFPDLDLADRLWQTVPAKANPADTRLAFLDPNTQTADFLQAIKNLGAETIAQAPETARAISEAPAAMREGLRDLVLKRHLNALSTGAFVLAGKVWGNIMIDLSISNLKLFDRACRIIAQITGQGDTEARLALTQTILQSSSANETVDPAELLGKAANRQKLVPLAILRLGANLDTKQGVKLLNRHPKVKDALQWAMEHA